MDNLALNIKLISDLIEKNANNTLAEFGVTLSQARVLNYIEKSDRQVSLKELEKSFNVSQATMQGVIARMEKKGYLCTVYLPENRRQKLVVLTEYGRQLTRDLFKNICSINNSLVNSLTEQEYKDFSVMLDKIRKSIEQ